MILTTKSVSEKQQQINDIQNLDIRAELFCSSFGRIEGMKYWFLNFPILKVQKMDMEKREKAAKERNANIERSKEELVAKVTGTKRKSKWDQAGPLGAPQPPITSIPAFGALSKK